MKTFSMFLMAGGEWLAGVRNWIQCKKRNGSRVTWGSDKPLDPPMTVREVEDLASDCSWAAYKMGYEAAKSDTKLQLDVYEKALEFCTGFKGSCPEGSRVAREALERFTDKLKGERCCYQSPEAAAAGLPGCGHCVVCVAQKRVDKCPKCGAEKAEFMSQCDQCFDAVFKGKRNYVTVPDGTYATKDTCNCATDAPCLIHRWKCVECAHDDVNLGWCGAHPAPLHKLHCKACCTIPACWTKA